MLQKNFGGSYDCSLTSITALGLFKNNYNQNADDIYSKVEKIAKKYFYSAEKFGTIPIFIKNIINNAFNVNSKSKYIKGVGFNWELIKKNIDNKNPMILSISNDGRNYYTNHSVTIVGYREYSPTNAKILVIYDNWSNVRSCIDYNKLSCISSINYF